MISPAGMDKIAGSLKTLSIIWAAMMVAVIAVGGVNVALYKNGLLPLVSDMDDMTQTILLAVLSFLAMAEIGGVVLFSVMFKGENIIKKRLEVAPPKNVEQSPSGAFLTENDRLAAALTPLYFSLCVIRWTLGFSVCVYGFILSAATAFMDVAVVFHTISLAIIAFFKPDAKEIEAMTEKAATISKDWF